MSQYFRQDYLKPAYFKVGYLRGADEEPTSDGRSGYWRLFFMQLQEEALKKKEELAPQETQQHEEAAKPPKTKKQKLPPLVPLEEYEKPNFKRKKIFTDPTEVQETLAPWMLLSSTVVDSWVSALVPIWAEHKKAIIQQREAANDAEYRIRLLLLAA